jgi:hypothetical protein
MAHEARGPMKLSRARLRKLMEEATVDAYNDSEQRVGFLTMIEENLKLPFKTHVLGVEVLVERVDMNASEEIVAVCLNGRTRQRIALLDLPLPSPFPRGVEWIEAYRHWDRGVN